MRSSSNCFRSWDYPSSFGSSLGPAAAPAFLLLGIGNGKREVENRPRPRRGLYPHPAAVPFNRLPAECQAESVPGKLFPVQTLKHSEDSLVKCGVDTGTIVLHRNHPLEVPAF